MTPTVYPGQAPIPPPSYYRTVAEALHVDALTLVRRLPLLAPCRVAVHLAHQHYPPPLPADPGGAPRDYSEASLLLLVWAGLWMGLTRARDLIIDSAPILA